MRITLISFFTSFLVFASTVFSIGNASLAPDCSTSHKGIMVYYPHAKIPSVDLMEAAVQIAGRHCKSAFRRMDCNGLLVEISIGEISGPVCDSSFKMKMLLDTSDAAKKDTGAECSGRFCTLKKTVKSAVYWKYQYKEQRFHYQIRPEGSKTLYNKINAHLRDIADNKFPMAQDSAALRIAHEVVKGDFAAALSADVCDIISINTGIRNPKRVIMNSENKVNRIRRAPLQTK